MGVGLQIFSRINNEVHNYEWKSQLIRVLLHGFMNVEICNCYIEIFHKLLCSLLLKMYFDRKSLN